MVKNEYGGLTSIQRILKKIQSKEGSWRQYEYCVSHKIKNEIELILGGHQVI